MAFKPTFSDKPLSPALAPLAQRMRPRTLDEIVGQDRLVGKGSLLRETLENGEVHSMILWGPPGCGKTTLSLLMSDYANAHFEALSAVLSGIADVRKSLAAARARFEEGVRTVLFVDEVHRFNKTQQDAFLPDIESGAIVFVGATTENPSFELNSALLSRCRVHVLDSVSPDAIKSALQSALIDPERGLGEQGVQIDEDALNTIARAADGDVRRGLTFLEIAASLARGRPIDEVILGQVLADRTRRFDKGGEQFYDQISALHKSVRSSDPDGAIYWFARMMDGGVDPSYLARRLLRMSVEDVGLADNQAQRMALDAWDTYERLGSPEGDLALAQIAVYLALIPKSNAIYAGYNDVREDIKATGTLAVPAHLRPPTTKLMRDIGYGAGYQYDHNIEGGVAMDQELLPRELSGKEYYRPLDKGMEANIKKYLTRFREERAAARRQKAT